MKSYIINGIIVFLFIISMDLQAQHYPVEIEKTGVSQLIIFLSSISNLDENVEIGIYDLNGLKNSGDCENEYGEVLVGSGLWADEQLNISVIGSYDNCSIEGGNQKAGFVPGNTIIVRIWDFSQWKEYETTLQISEGDDLFSSPGSSTISELNNLVCIYNCGPPDCSEGYDCSGECGGSAVFDECGVCGGGGIEEGKCDCADNVDDCADVCGGDAVLSGCDNACNSTAVEDCVGECGGTAELDECDVCGGIGIPEGQCDCAGNISDCFGTCGGSFVEDNCGTCDNDPSNNCIKDCAGNWGGAGIVDECGVCGGSGIPEGKCNCAGNVKDCAEVCGGSAVNDECGICGGDNSSCSGCLDNTVGIDTDINSANTCGGNNNEGCFALNYDPDAIVQGICEYPVYGCLDSLALNYDSDATHSDNNCDYPPEVGISFGNIDVANGTLEILLNSDKDLNELTFSISGANISGILSGIDGDISASTTFTASGNIGAGSGSSIILSFTDGAGEICFTTSSAVATGYDSVNITLGGCAVFVGTDGGTVASDDAGVDIPAGALTESESISVGDVTEELSEEVDNATGFKVEEMTAFTPFDIVFEEPVEISISYDDGTRNDRDDEYLCYLEDANDTEWEIIDGASCTNGVCTADVNSFGIFATCILIEDCNGELGGFSYLDDCGECVGGNTGNTALYTLDDCGLCGGPGEIIWYSDTDGDNLGYGNGVEFCSDSVEEGYVRNDDDLYPNCADNYYDCNDVCGGSAYPDPYFLEDSCTANACVGGDTGAEACAMDCNGNWGGIKLLDDCNVCDGNGIPDGQCDCGGNISDCMETCGGGSVEDNCGTCDNDPSNNCIKDCNGDWGGPDNIPDSGDEAIVDACGVCGGGNSSCADCAGTPNGDAIEDNCGTCDSDSSNDCVQDCNDDWGGLATTNTYYYDTDGDGTGCDGNNTSECDPVTCTSDGCIGDGEEGDCVHNFCSAMIPSSWYLDYSSDCDACTAGYDECGVCGGDGIADGTCDCAGNIDLGCGCGAAGPSGCDNACGSTLENDECDECGGTGVSAACGCTDTSGLNAAGCCDVVVMGCDDVCGSGLIFDECGICGGPGATDECSCDGIADGTCDCAGNIDLGCGCGAAGPSGCDNACGSTLENDECDECGGDGIAEACNCMDTSSLNAAGCCDSVVMGCDGNCGSGLINDDCNECGGDNQCAGILYSGLIPEDFSIQSIYPNPFNPVTNIIYTLPEYTSVQILVFDLSGIQVQSLINQMQSPGYYSVDWNAIPHPSGVYFVRMIAGDYISTQKLMLVK